MRFVTSGTGRDKLVSMAAETFGIVVGTWFGLEPAALATWATGALMTARPFRTRRNSDGCRETERGIARRGRGELALDR